MSPREVVKLKDVATAAGVSITTASMALSGTGRVSEDTRSRVRETARHLGYSANRPAQNLRKARKGAIGLYIPGQRRFRPYYMEFSFGVVGCAQEHNQLVVLFTAPAGEPPAGESSGFEPPTEVDGYVLIDATADDPRVADILATGLPVVTGDFPADSFAPPAGVVTAEHARVFGELLDHLAEAGARRPLLLLPGDDSAWAHTLRLEYEKWCHATGTPTAIHRVPFAPTPDEIRAIVGGILESDAGAGVDALIVAPDDVAVGAMSAVIDRGLQPQRDILIASCVDSSMMEMASPPITSIDLDPRRMGWECARLLHDILEGDLAADERRYGDDGETIVRTYPIGLRIRASSQEA